MPLRLAFMGTPDFAVPALEALIAAGHDVVCVYTQPPRPKGRGQHVTMSAVHAYTEPYHIPVRCPLSFKKSPEACAEFAALKVDVAVVAAYGLILPPVVLAAPRLGCLNIHASLLPRWRGASPIQHAIWAGDTETGVTIMQMDAGLDTGKMIAHSSLPLSAEMTTPELHDRLSGMGAQLIVDVLAKAEKTQRIDSTPQPSAGVTYAPLLTKENGKIDWRQPAAAIDAQIRALNPWPGTYTILPDGTVLRILAARMQAGDKRGASGTILDRSGHVACGDGGLLCLTQVQAPSGKKMDMASFLNGGYAAVGDAFVS